MTGYVDKYLQPKIKIQVNGLLKSLQLDAIIDTGFNGDLCLPIGVAIQVGLILCGNQDFELADGSIRQDLIFLGQAVLENKERTVEISVTNSEDALIGCNLLKGYKLEIGFQSQTLAISPEVTT